MSISRYLVAMVVGGAATYGALNFLPITNMNSIVGASDMDVTANSEPEPLYWVAPMDSNYRRDKPGKSPMGMDLIPFYGDDAAQNSPGTVAISPEVVNNLGVRTGSVKNGVLEQTVNTVGYLVYNADRLVHMHARVNGWVEKLYVTANGDPVKKGDPLYDLYSPELVNAQEELLFALNRNDQRLIKAAEERLSSLQVPSSFVAQLKRQRKVSQTIRFFAPQNGVIDNLGIRDGFYITPGLTLMSIADLDELWLEAEVFERQAHLLKVGQSIEAQTDFLPGETLQSQISFIYPNIDEKTRTVRVRVRLDNKDLRLKPNMYAHLSIDAKESKSTLLIPKEALIRGAKQDRVVLALGEGRFKSIAVTAGRYGDDDVEILSGLQQGDQIVTSAQFLLDSESSKSSDFMRMSPVEDSSSDMDHSAHDSMANMSDTSSTEPPKNVWVAGKINSIDKAARKVNVDHSAIPDWKWPEMTMDFKVAEWVELSELPVGKNIQLEITKESSTRFSLTDFYDADAQ
ncbi:efflux RND transporter periplasmic adaptor subunit [Rhodanobacter aciditrophus]|uniref:Efflux RND transporter periplasmic adaptor subunit n=1 Tax=Rhodanobacter aciditrophus TaxID=1623218 RepID=A0ABW4B287_9GAMM